MKQITRGIICTLISALLICSFALTGCANLAPSQADATTVTQTVDDADLVTAGTLTVGIDYDNAPYSGVSGSDVQGIDVDVASALADAMGLKVAFVDISSTSGPVALSSNECDIFMSYEKSDSTSTSTTNNGATYIGTYIKDATSLFALSADGSDVTVDTNSLKSSTIAAQKNSVTAVTVAQRYGTSVLQETSSLTDAFGTLESGSADYAAAPGVAGKYLSTSYDDIVWAAAISNPVEIGIGGNKNGTAVNDAVANALNTISSNGVLDLIITKWIGSPLDLSTTATTTSTTSTTTTTGNSAAVTSSTAPVATDTTTTTTDAAATDATTTDTTDENTDAAADNTDAAGDTNDDTASTDNSGAA